MDFTSFWFLMVMVVVGGLVAVLADNLGRKLGKSRLRLGKLRPRHTAMLFTAITGAVVTLITILLVAALSAEARQWIIEGRTAIKSAQDQIALANQMRQQLTHTMGELNTANGDLARRKADIAKLQKELEAAKGDKLKYEGLAGKAEVQASKAAGLLRDRERRLKALSGDLNRAKGKLDEVNATYQKLSTTYKKLDQNYAKLGENYATLRKQTDESYNQNRDLQKQNMELESSNGKLLTDVTDLNGKIKRGQKDLDDLLTKIDEQNKRFATASEVFEFTLNNIRGSRILPIIYNLNDEIVRRDVGLVLTLADAEDKVRTTLSIAAESVYRTTNKEMNLLDVIQGRITPDSLVSQLSRQLLDSKGPAMIIVTSAVNIFGDEPIVPVNIVVVANSVVFKKGEVLGEVRIDGSASVESIIGQLSNMLQTQVRQKAVQARMLGKKDDNGFGTVNPSDTVKLVNAIHAAGRPVRIQAQAKSDIRVSGPLEIEFKVR